MGGAKITREAATTQRKSIHALIRDEHGFSHVATVMFIVAFVILTAVVVTYFQASQVYEEVRTALNRCANAAVQLATPDEYRREAIMHLDIDAAEAEMKNGMLTHMGLDSSGMAKSASGQILYKVDISGISAIQGTARLTVTGTIHIPVTFFREVTGELYIPIPFSITSRNQRLD